MIRPIIVAAALSALPASAQTPPPAAQKLPLASVEARWQGAFCDLMEVSKPSTDEMMVRVRYRNEGRAAIRFPDLKNYMVELQVFDPATTTLFGVLKDTDGAPLSSSTLGENNIGRSLAPRAAQAHWAKVQPPPSPGPVTVLAPGCMPFENIVPGSVGTAKPLMVPPAPIASQEGDDGLVVEVLELRRVGAGLVNLLMRYRNTGSARFRFPDLKDVTRRAYLTDPKNRVKYEVLTDSERQPVVGTTLAPAQTSGDRIEPGRALNVWAKFPAPPENVKIVSLTAFGAPPFDGLEITGTPWR